MHTSVEVIQCTECGASMEHIVSHKGFQAGGTTIGPDTIHCPKCGASHESGKSEWLDKSFSQKARFVLHRLFWLVFGAVVAGGFFATLISRVLDEFYAFDADEREYYFYRIFIGIAVLMAVLLIGNAYREIRNSIRRSKVAQA